MHLLDTAAREAIVAHYAQRRHRLYARWKLKTDPVYAATAALLRDSALPLLDIGCGIGLLGQYLHASGARVRYAGVDHDGFKIDTAQAAARHAGLERELDLRCADAATLPPVSGHVVLLDILHYLPADRHRALLQVATGHLAPDGLLVIRNVLREANWRFHATRVEEFFLRYSGWIPGGAQHYPSADELREPLEAAGLAVHIAPLRGRTPFNSYLLVARHRAPDSETP
ncbi:MAG: class I SAM-dependent methyltransferase [Xanthomonadales bacterium]|nr:class I SAM-dependent methyltransferase [Xanthomonadales bacterium]